MSDIRENLKDSKVVASFYIGSLEYFLQKWQGYLRNLKHTKYQDYKFVIMMNSMYHVFVQDFVEYTINLPKEFYELNLEPENYEAVLPDAHYGSFTPPDVYSELISYIRSVYNLDNTKEIWSPRGDSTISRSMPQTFCKFSSDPIENDRPIIVVFPGANKRRDNIPEYVWLELVRRLQAQFTVVLAGMKHESCLQELTGDNIVNLIDDETEDNIEETIVYLSSAACSISTQCSGSHISLFSGCPSYIIGNDKQKYMGDNNRINTPVSFQTVLDIKSVNADSILMNVSNFLQELDKQGFVVGKSAESKHDAILSADINILNEIIKGRHE